MKFGVRPFYILKLYVTSDFVNDGEIGKIRFEMENATQWYLDSWWIGNVSEFGNGLGLTSHFVIIALCAFYDFDRLIVLQIIVIYFGCCRKGGEFSCTFICVPRVGYY